MNDQRRRFCQAGGGLILASAILPSAGGCLGSGNPGTGGSTLVYVGTTDQLPVGEILPANMTGMQTINVCHDAGGFFAVAGNCTHANCVLLFADPANPMGFACPCHQSTFDYNGQNPTGPAAMTGPLKHYKVTLQGNKIYVDTGAMVDISVRVTM